MLKIGDRVKLDKSNDFIDSETIVKYAWWEDMEDMGTLTVSKIDNEDSEKVYSIKFHETDYGALNTWVTKV